MIVGVFLLAGTVVAIVTGVSLAHPGTFLDRIWNLNRAAYVQFTFLGTLAGYMLLGIAVITGLAGYGLLKVRKWAWWTAASIFAMNGAGDAVNIFIGEPLKGIAGLIIAGCFLLYLFRPSTKAYFAASANAAQVSQVR
jgi:uncharacterized membrane protein (DUF2068 family)